MQTPCFYCWGFLNPHMTLVFFLKKSLILFSSCFFCLFTYCFIYLQFVLSFSVTWNVLLIICIISNSKTNWCFCCLCGFISNCSFFLNVSFILQLTRGDCVSVFILSQVTRMLYGFLVRSNNSWFQQLIPSDLMSHLGMLRWSSFLFFYYYFIHYWTEMWGKAEDMVVNWWPAGGVCVSRGHILDSCIISKTVILLSSVS